MIYQLKAKILRNEKIKGECFHCQIQAPAISRICLPGQFVNIKVSATLEPLLRRPFSIHGVSGGKLRIFYEVVGQASRLLAQRKTGECLDIIGPLGNGFHLPTTNYERRTTILVAGGMGVAPLIFLAAKLAEAKTRNPKIKTTVLIGARTKSQVLCEREFKALGCAVSIATDDGSRGFKGRVTDLLRNILQATGDRRQATIYACGPRSMLREVARIAGEARIPAQVSLEEHLACGFGACLGCAVKTARGYRRVCKDGPVFNADEISWGK